LTTSLSVPEGLGNDELDVVEVDRDRANAAEEAHPLAVAETSMFSPMLLPLNTMVSAEERVVACTAVDRDRDQEGQVPRCSEGVIAAVGVEDEVLGGPEVLPPRPKTWIRAVLATVGVPPMTGTAPPFTRIFPAASRLTTMVLSRLSPNTVRKPTCRPGPRREGEAMPSSGYSRTVRGSLASSGLHHGIAQPWQRDSIPPSAPGCARPSPAAA
jgi:hypothetical protein